MSVERKYRGFTLIEVIVVVAIVAIMAGIMVPMLYRVWDSADEEKTRERMKDLKVALVGDSRLIQSGVRTHFGYAGDAGQLPTSLENLVANVDGAANWNGPYLPGGYDPAEFDKDAWRNPFEYLPTTDASGRRVAATLRSYGPDGVASTADDVADAGLQISADDVAPASLIQGNVVIAFQSPPQSSKSYYIGVAARYRNGAGTYTTDVCCDNSAPKTVSGTAGNTQVNYTHTFSCAPPVNLPVGIVFTAAALFTNSSCGTALPGGGTPIENASTVSGRSLFVNLQIQSVIP